MKHKNKYGQDLTPDEIKEYSKIKINGREISPDEWQKLFPEMMTMHALKNLTTERNNIETMAGLRKYVNDHYYNVHPKTYTLEPLMQIKRNVSRWESTLKHQTDFNTNEIQERNKTLSFFSDFFRDVTLDIERLKKQQPKKKKADEPETLKDIFVKPDHYDPCLNVLQKIGVINSNNEYTGNNKGVFKLWVKELEVNGFIKKQSNVKYSRLINKAVKGANLTHNASEFTKWYGNAERSDIPDDIKYFLSEIKK